MARGDGAGSSKGKEPANKEGPSPMDEDAPAAKASAVYLPSKLREGSQHPDKCTESETLAEVTAPDLYDHKGKMFAHAQHDLKDVVKKASISALQLETVCYSNMRFSKRLPNIAKGPQGEEIKGDGGKEKPRCGFFLGDGAGVGKGRQIAACALEHFRRGGRRCLWVSVTNELKVDARRDLNDLGVSLDCVGEKNDTLQIFPKDKEGTMPRGKLKYGDGILFCTFSLLIQSTAGQQPRLEQIIKWLEGDEKARGAKDGGALIVFDECHRAKNLLPAAGKTKPGQPERQFKPSKTAVSVVELQNRLPHARVLYASATGASVPQNLAYMVRLGSFEFDSMTELVRSLDAKGTGALELFAHGIKRSGAYLCRTLSYDGAEFEVNRLQFTAADTTQYDRSAEFWIMLYRVILQIGVADSGAGARGQNAAQKEARKATRMGMTLFWGAHLRFFKSLLMGFKVPQISKMTNEAVEAGHSVVIGLQSTGESGIDRAVADAKSSGEDLTELVSAPMGVVMQFIQGHFPIHVMAASRNATQKKQMENMIVKVNELVKAWETTAEKDAEQDEDCVFEQVKDTDQIEKEKELAAIRTGAFIDMTDDGDEGDFAKAQKEIRDAKQKAKVAAKTSAGASGSNKRSQRASESEAPTEAPAELNKGGRPTRAAAKDKRYSDDGAGANNGGDGSDDDDGGFDAGALSDSDGDFGGDDDGGSTHPSRAPSPKGKGKAPAFSVKTEKQPAKRQRRASDSTTVSNASGRSDKKAIHRSDDDDDDDGMDEDDYADSDSDDDMAPAGAEWVLDPNLREIRDLLLRAAKALKLPANPLDDLLDRCGGVKNVAEMTGRKSRIVKTSDGKVAQESRSKGLDGGLKAVNLHERDAFMQGSKHVAIISEAASTGISLHSDRRFDSSTRRRVHITMELPWASQNAIQQLGRSHRSNQETAPIYRLTVSDCGGEWRFASATARRLMTLGALLKGDRTDLGAGKNMESFDVDTKWGAHALKHLLESIKNARDDGLNVEYPKVEKVTANAPDCLKSTPPKPSKGDKDFFDCARNALASVALMTVQTYAAPSYLGAGAQPRKVFQLEKTATPVSRFLNRILGLEHADQQLLFKAFERTLEQAIEYAKSDGKYDRGTSTLEGKVTTIAPFPVQVHACTSSGAKTYISQIEIDKGVSYDEALALLAKANKKGAESGTETSQNGFYISNNIFGENTKARRIWLCTEIKTKSRDRQLLVVSPANCGNTDRKTTTERLERNYRKVQTKGSAALEKLWTFWYDEAIDSGKGCYATEPKAHGAGMRVSRRQVISGAILPIYRSITESILSTSRSDLAQQRREDAEDGAELKDSDDEGGGFGGQGNKSMQDEKDEDAKKNVRLTRYMPEGATTATLGILVPAVALEKIGEMLDSLGGLGEETEQAISAHDSNATLWSMLGIATPAQRKKKKDDEAKALKKEQERVQKQRQDAMQQYALQAQQRALLAQQQQARYAQQQAAGGAGAGAYGGAGHMLGTAANAVIGGVSGLFGGGADVKPKTTSPKKIKAVRKKQTHRRR